MAARIRRGEISAIVRALEERATESAGVPAAAAAYAARATLAAAYRQPSRVTHRSLEAYFDKVAARQTVRRHGGSEAAARLVADAVVADIVASGRTGRDAFDELARGWGELLPAQVIDGYRERLCA